MRLDELLHRAFNAGLLDPGEMQPGQSLVIIADPDGFILSAPITEHALRDAVSAGAMFEVMARERDVRRRREA